MLKYITPKMMELLPHLCAMESYDIDRDLQAHCVRVSSGQGEVSCLVSVRVSGTGLQNGTRAG